MWAVIVITVWAICAPFVAFHLGREHKAIEVEKALDREARKPHTGLTTTSAR